MYYVGPAQPSRDWLLRLWVILILGYRVALERTSLHWHQHVCYQTLPFFGPLQHPMNGPLRRVGPGIGDDP